MAVNSLQITIKFFAAGLAELNETIGTLRTHSRVSVVFLFVLVGFSGCTSHRHEPWSYPGAKKPIATTIHGLNIALVNGPDRRPANMAENSNPILPTMHALPDLIIHGVLTDLQNAKVGDRIAMDPAALDFYDFVFVFQLFCRDGRKSWLQVDGFSSTGGLGFHSTPIELGTLGGPNFNATQYDRLRKTIEKVSNEVFEFLNSAAPSTDSNALAKADADRRRQFELLYDLELTEFREEMKSRVAHGEGDSQLITALAQEYKRREEKLEIMRLIEREHADQVTTAYNNYFDEKTKKIDALRAEYLAAKRAEDDARTTAVFGAIMSGVASGASGYAGARGADTSGLNSSSQAFARLATESAKQASELHAQAEKVKIDGDAIIARHFGDFEKYPEFRDLKGSIFQIREQFRERYLRGNRSIATIRFEIDGDNEEPMPGQQHDVATSN